MAWDGFESWAGSDWPWPWWPWKGFQLYPSEMGNDGRVLYSGVLCELWVFKKSTLAAVYSRLEEEGEDQWSVDTKGVYSVRLIRWCCNSPAKKQLYPGLWEDRDSKGEGQKMDLRYILEVELSWLVEGSDVGVGEKMVKMSSAFCHFCGSYDPSQFKITFLYILRSLTFS